VQVSKEEVERSRAIDNELKKERRAIDREVKLLLLGAGESGKSTIAKQMKVIHLEGFTQDELINYRPIIHNNTLTSIKALVLANRKLGIGLEPQNEDVAETFAQINPLKVELNSELASQIITLWKDDGILKTFDRQSEFQLPDVAKYCFDNIERISNPNYIPNTGDCLRCRARTTGIIEVFFIVDGVSFRMVDVGGQRSERKKWIHCFQDVTALIFCVALSEYDMKLYEDENVNRMHESMELFDEICNSKWFLKTSIILFLNKSDIFQEKILKKDLRCCFPDYNGGNDFLYATQFIEQKFSALNKYGANKQIYTHITCATDTENIKFVFNAVKDIILYKSLQSSGF